MLLSLNKLYYFLLIVNVLIQMRKVRYIYLEKNNHCLFNLFKGSYKTKKEY